MRRSALPAREPLADASPPHSGDAALVDQIRAGDEEAFESLLQAYYDDLRVHPAPGRRLGRSRRARAAHLPRHLAAGNWRPRGSLRAYRYGSARFKRERGIEPWLEGRRLGDLRRWLQENTPGEMEDMTGRDLCFPIGLTEIETNRNIDG